MGPCEKYVRQEINGFGEPRYVDGECRGAVAARRTYGRNAGKRRSAFSKPPQCGGQIWGGAQREREQPECAQWHGLGPCAQQLVVRGTPQILDDRCGCLLRNPRILPPQGRWWHTRRAKRPVNVPTMPYRESRDVSHTVGRHCVPELTTWRLRAVTQRSRHSTPADHVRVKRTRPS
jgi:hypothetical protein